MSYKPELSHSDSWAASVVKERLTHLDSELLILDLYCTYERLYAKLSIRGRSYFAKLVRVDGSVVSDRYGHLIIDSSTLRLRNEDKALNHVHKRTSVPVPRVVWYSVAADNPFIVTEYIDSRLMADLTDPCEIETCLSQVRAFERQLQQYTYPEMASFAGKPIPPSRLCLSTADFGTAAKWHDIQPKAGYPLCHGDMTRDNMLVSLHAPQVVAVIDWEYARFYPQQLSPLYAAEPSEGVRLGSKVVKSGDYSAMCLELARSSG